MIYDVAIAELQKIGRLNIEIDATLLSQIIVNQLKSN